MKNWVVRSKSADFEYLVKKHKISEVLARILVNRGLREDEDIHKFLHPSIDDLYDPIHLKDMDKACDILQDKIGQKKKVRIVGDYDVDGITATYILYNGLKKCGAKVDYEIPDRVRDGYGINESIIQAAYDDGIDTILTCDNGIAAFDQVELAKALGMTFIITDHHDLPAVTIDGEEREKTPNADAIINPKQSKCNYPNENLCGAAVGFKLIQSLYRRYGFGTKDLLPLLEVVAIATVCDVMDLVDENRIFVKLGLEYLRKTSNYGIKALMDLSALRLDKLKAYHLGFVIGPCLNASGRLDTAKKGLKLLLTESKEEAYEIASELKELNDLRKDMTKKGIDKAKELVDTSELKDDKVLVVYLPDCHQSVAGIIAGRIRDHYYKPTFVLTKTEKAVKGSGRSLEMYNMFKELQKVEKHLIQFGGHPMAAGLSLEEEDVEPLRRALNQTTTLTDKDLIAKVKIDVVLPLGYISEELISELEILEPFGKANPKPVFAERNVKVLSATILGKNKNVLKFKLINEYNREIEAIYFGDIEVFLNELKTKFKEGEVDKMFKNLDNSIKFNITYFPEINDYRGLSNIQIQIKDFLIV